MGVLHGLEIGTGSISATQRQVSEALAGAVTRAQQFVGQHKAQYVDETSWRESQRLKWLWVNASQDVTVLGVLSGRGANEAKQMIEESAKGIITSDRLASYNWLTGRRRQIYWAHLARDFQALAERGGESAKTGQALLTQVKRLFTLWHELRDGGQSRGAFRQAMKPVQRRVKKLLQVGAKSTHTKTRHTCTNILKVERSLWTLVRVEGVEPTNNDAERCLRRAVLWRRKSFGTKSESGSRFVERILTAVQRLRQQGRDVLEYLTDACRDLLVKEGTQGLIPDTS